MWKSNMKKIFVSALLLMSGMCIFTGCDDDRDSNPTLQQPETFLLNTPAYATSDIDLENSSKLRFTCSQPNYGYTAAVTYNLQLSLTNSFTTSVDEAEEEQIPDYAVVDESYTSCNIATDASLFAKAVMQLGQWEDGSVPATQTVNVRLTATVGQSIVASNIVNVEVVPYYIELTSAEVEMWYLIGACIGDGKWTNSPSGIGTSIYPMSTVKDCEYDKKTGKGELTFTGYFTLDGDSPGFKLVHTLDSKWPDQWGQGDAFGTFVKNDGGAKNITVPEAGYYTVVLDTKNDELTVTKADITPTVYTSMCITGDYAGEAWPDNAMTAVNTVVEKNHVWSYVLESSADTGVKFKTPGGWDTNWGNSGFPYGSGVSGGGNIPATAGKYIVTFNDIDGSYAFTATE